MKKKYLFICLSLFVVFVIIYFYKPKDYMPVQITQDLCKQILLSDNNTYIYSVVSIQAKENSIVAGYIAQKDDIEKFGYVLFTQKENGRYEFIRIGKLFSLPNVKAAYNVISFISLRKNTSQIADYVVLINKDKRMKEIHILDSSQSYTITINTYPQMIIFKLPHNGHFSFYDKHGDELL